MIPEGYRIRELSLDDAPALAAAYERNREHLGPWEPDRTASWFTADGQSAAIAGQLTAAAQGLVVPWVLVREGQVVGRVNLNNLVMGVLRSASIGYWVDAAHLGPRAGLRCGRVRVRAGAGPRAAPGGGRHAGAQHRLAAGARGVRLRVLRHRARSYLFIAGAWQDHRLYQRILHDRPAVAHCGTIPSKLARIRRCGCP